MFSLMETGPYTISIQCFHCIETVYLVCIPNPVTRAPVSRALALSLTQNDHGSKGL